MTGVALCLGSRVARTLLCICGEVPPPLGHEIRLMCRRESRWIKREHMGFKGGRLFVEELMDAILTSWGSHAPLAVGTTCIWD